MDRDSGKASRVKIKGPWYESSLLYGDWHHWTLGTCFSDAAPVIRRRRWPNGDAGWRSGSDPGPDQSRDHTALVEQVEADTAHLDNQAAMFAIASQLVLPGLDGTVRRDLYYRVWALRCRRRGEDPDA